MSLSQEITSWVRELLAQEIEKSVAPLRAEIDQVDDWANGVFAALADVLPLLLRKHPDVAGQLEPMWRKISEQYNTVDSTDQADDFHQTQGLLEARKMLYRQLAVLKAWPERPAK